MSGLVCQVTAHFREDVTLIPETPKGSSFTSGLSVCISSQSGITIMQKSAAAFAVQWTANRSELSEVCGTVVLEHEV